jgi:flagellar biosynthetic protein FlhB
MAVLFTAAAGALLMGPTLIGGLAAMMRRGLQWNRTQLLDPRLLPITLQDTLLGALATVAPFLLLLWVAALLAPLALGGWSFSMSALGLQWERLSPLKGLKRIFSVHGLTELLKALGKFVFITAVTVGLLWTQSTDLLQLGDEPVGLALRDAARGIGWAFFVLTLPLVVLAAVDVPLQLWQHAQQLRMTRQEVRDELKETEGRPEVKGRMRRLQQQMASRRMMSEVRRADVIITNPTHYAVALTYMAKTMRAPRVVAKGADWMALQMRIVGTSHSVPVVETPVLARALYFSTDINREIPVGLYLAVAQVLAYVYQLRARGSVTDRPIAMPDLPVPDDFRHF